MRNDPQYRQRLSQQYAAQQRGRSQKQYTNFEIAKILRQKSDKRTLKEERKTKYYHYLARKDKIAINAFADYTPRLDEPTEHKYHRDFVLQEMNWMAIDFQEEKKLKKALLYRVAHEAAEYVAKNKGKGETFELHQRTVALRLASMVQETFSKVNKNIPCGLKPAMAGHINQMTR